MPETWINANLSPPPSTSDVASALRPEFGRAPVVERRKQPIDWLKLASIWCMIIGLVGFWLVVSFWFWMTHRHQ